MYHLTHDRGNWPDWSLQSRSFSVVFKKKNEQSGFQYFGIRNVCPVGGIRSSELDKDALALDSQSFYRLEETWREFESAFGVEDWKSLFDLLQKTSIPQCTEYGTMLETLVIKDRLSDSEGVIIKWVHSAARMTDSLTKDMDTGVLQEFLKYGKDILHDVDEILKQSADKQIHQQ